MYSHSFTLSAIRSFFKGAYISSSVLINVSLGMWSTGTSQRREKETAMRMEEEGNIKSERERVGQKDEKNPS